MSEIGSGNEEGAVDQPDGAEVIPGGRPPCVPRLGVAVRRKVPDTAQLQGMQQVSSKQQ